MPQRGAGALVSSVAAVRAAVLHQRRPLPPVGLQAGGGRGQGMMSVRHGTRAVGQHHMHHGSGVATQGKQQACAWFSPQHEGWAAAGRAAGCRRASGRCGGRAPAAACYSQLPAWRRRPRAADPPAAPLRRCKAAGTHGALGRPPLLLLLGREPQWCVSRLAPLAPAAADRRPQAVRRRRQGRRPLPAPPAPAAAAADRPPRRCRWLPHTR